MPELKCSVVTCAHNSKNYCELDSIEVIGSSATSAKQTSCGSFTERKGDCCCNAAKADASAMSTVNCQATGCQYNNGCKCHAGKVSVTGKDACRTEETECTTFKM